MWKMRWLVMSAIMAIVVTGCSKPAGTTDSADVPNNAAGRSAESGGEDHAKLDGPAAALKEFLHALRTGDDRKATEMLSTVAREKMAAQNRNVTPTASDTASFAIGAVDYVNDDGARVVCHWTDLDEERQPKTDKAVWVLRREQGVWRIAGVAYQLFPGEEPLLLNFEDPEDMFRQQQWGREEIRRRTDADALQAQEGENHENSLRR